MMRRRLALPARWLAHRRRLWRRARGARRGCMPRSVTAPGVLSGWGRNRRRPHHGRAGWPALPSRLLAAPRPRSGPGGRQAASFLCAGRVSAGWRRCYYARGWGLWSSHAAHGPAGWPGRCVSQRSQGPLAGGVAALTSGARLPALRRLLAASGGASFGYLCSPRFCSRLGSGWAAFVALRRSLSFLRNTCPGEGGVGGTLGV